MWDTAGYVERGRKQAEYELKQLKMHIRYLERCHYVERVREGEERLYKLTAKGKFELLHLRLAEHMREQRTKPWDRTWRVMIFDVKEEMKKYRDFLRRLLKNNGFQMWQFSVWVSKYNPEPALGALLKYLDLKDCYAIIKADCTTCNPRVVKKWRQMQRKKEDG